MNPHSYVADVRRVLADPAEPRVESGRGSHRLGSGPTSWTSRLFPVRIRPRPSRREAGGRSGGRPPASLVKGSPSGKELADRYDKSLWSVKHLSARPRRAEGREPKSVRQQVRGRDAQGTSEWRPTRQTVRLT